jgi:predicted nucleotidyltransferase
MDRKIGSTIEELYTPDALILFGSYAHGQPDEWSDVDLLFISDAFASVPKLRRRSQFLVNTGAYLHEGLGLEPLCLTPDEFLRGIQWATIEQEALETGVVILDRIGITQVREVA